MIEEPFSGLVAMYWDAPALLVNGKNAVVPFVPSADPASPRHCQGYIKPRFHSYLRRRYLYYGDDFAPDGPIRTLKSPGPLAEAWEAEEEPPTPVQAYLPISARSHVREPTANLRQRGLEAKDVYSKNRSRGATVAGHYPDEINFNRATSSRASVLARSESRVSLAPRLTEDARREKSKTRLPVFITQEESGGSELSLKLPRVCNLGDGIENDKFRDEKSSSPMHSKVKNHDVESVLKNRIKKVVGEYNSIPGWKGERNMRQLGTIVSSRYMNNLISGHKMPLKMENCYNCYID